MILSLLTMLAVTTPTASGDDPGPLVRSLWLFQSYGSAAALDPANDQRLKGTLAKALGKNGELTLSRMDGFMEPDVFNKLAGSDNRLNASEISQAVKQAEPDSRRQLLPEVRRYADMLTTSFDMIDQAHRRAGQELAEWIVRSYRPGQSLDVVVVCTGNSRRSILGAMLGNIAAAYYGLPEVRFHSGGTAPTAFNPRTVRCLEEIGVEVEPTGIEAKRGEPNTANPVYRVRWGTAGKSGPMETNEFSKHYTDPTNPNEGFAALMVCAEADAGCPFVRGATLRVSMPYLDPKIYDDSRFEAAKYAERRDDIGRLMLCSMMRARHAIIAGAERSNRNQ
jgi:protein-tyrosine-phosphatase